MNFNKKLIFVTLILTKYVSFIFVIYLFLLILRHLSLLYDNEYTSIIDIYFYEFFLCLKPWALVLQNIWDTLSDILDKCLSFSLIKIEPVSINPSLAALSLFSFSVVYTFPLKMLSLVLVKN